MKNLLLFITLCNIANIFSGQSPLTILIDTPTALKLSYKLDIGENDDCGNRATPLNLDCFIAPGISRVNPILKNHDDLTPIFCKLITVEINGKTHVIQGNAEEFKKHTQVLISVKKITPESIVEGADEEYDVHFEVKRVNPSRCIVQ